MAVRKEGKRGKAPRRGGPPRAKGRGPQLRGHTRKRGAVRVTPLPAEVESDGKVRLNRFLAGAGICSRRAADGLIEAGRVTVNGRPVHELGTRVDPVADDVRFDAQRVQAEKRVYVLFNKPKGVVCTNARNEQRKRVIDYLEAVRGRIYTVGRLDAESEGLILLTNDGDFALEMAHPRHGVPKTYAVLVRGNVAPEDLAKVRGGVWLAEGRTGGADVRIERRSRDRTYLKVTIREGKNREVRRVFAKLGAPVLSLKRVRIGTLSLHGLKPGGYRFLRPTEIDGLRAIARKDVP